MGFEASISRDPTDDELKAMQSLLKQALDDGYAGFSTDALPFIIWLTSPTATRQFPLSSPNIRKSSA